MLNGTRYEYSGVPRGKRIVHGYHEKYNDHSFSSSTPGSQRQQSREAIGTVPGINPPAVNEDKRPFSVSNSAKDACRFHVNTPDSASNRGTSVDVGNTPRRSRAPYEWDDSPLKATPRSSVPERQFSVATTTKDLFRFEGTSPKKSVSNFSDRQGLTSAYTNMELHHRFEMSSPMVNAPLRFGTQKCGGDRDAGNRKSRNPLAWDEPKKGPDDAKVCKIDLYHDAGDVQSPQNYSNMASKAAQPPTQALDSCRMTPPGSSADSSRGHVLHDRSARRNQDATPMTSIIAHHVPYSSSRDFGDCYSSTYGYGWGTDSGSRAASVHRHNDDEPAAGVPTKTVRSSSMHPPQLQVGEVVGTPRSPSGMSQRSLHLGATAAATPDPGAGIRNGVAYNTAATATPATPAATTINSKSGSREYAGTALRNGNSTTFASSTAGKNGVLHNVHVPSRSTTKDSYGSLDFEATKTPAPAGLCRWIDSTSNPSPAAVQESERSGICCTSKPQTSSMYDTLIASRYDKIHNVHVHNVHNNSKPFPVGSTKQRAQSVDTYDRTPDDKKTNMYISSYNFQPQERQAYVNEFEYSAINSPRRRACRRSVPGFHTTKTTHSDDPGPFDDRIDGRRRVTPNAPEPSICLFSPPTTAVEPRSASCDRTPKGVLPGMCTNQSSQMIPVQAMRPMLHLNGYNRPQNSPITHTRFIPNTNGDVAVGGPSSAQSEKNLLDHATNRFERERKSPSEPQKPSTSYVEMLSRKQWDSQYKNTARPSTNPRSYWSNARMNLRQSIR